MSPIVNFLIIGVIVVFAGYFVINFLNKRKNEIVEDKVKVDDKTYTLEKMTEFVKKRLDEITKINLYDIGLTEDEINRISNKLI